jgi:GNAT superfamily N-acetyltransferase
VFETVIRPTERLTAAQLDELRHLLDETFGPRFDNVAWEHCLGGTHFMLRYHGRLVSHVSLVPRLFEQGGRRINGVYGESMVTVPDLQGKGIGTIIAAMASADVLLHYELGAFAASKYHFYERLGWRKWAGPTFVLTESGRHPAAPERGAVMALIPPGSAVDAAHDLTTDWRPGDVW